MLIAYDWPEQATDGPAPIHGLRFQNIFPPRPGRSGALFGIPHVLSPRQNEHSPSKATVRQSSTAFSPSSKYAPSDRPINRELTGHDQPGWQFRQCGILSEAVGAPCAGFEFRKYPEQISEAFACRGGGVDRLFGCSRGRAASLTARTPRATRSIRVRPHVSTGSWPSTDWSVWLPIAWLKRISNHQNRTPIVIVTFAAI